MSNPTPQSPVALITGASRGIGKACAHAFAQVPYRLSLFSRSISTSDVADLPFEPEFYAGSVSSEEDVNAWVESSFTHFGQIDVLVLNAGIGHFGSISELSMPSIREVMEVNVAGSFQVLKAVLPHMKKAGKGHVICVTSDVAKRTFAGGSAYCASKYAQHAMLDALRQEAYAYGVRVSEILPGLTATHFADGDPREPEKQAWLQAADVADAVRYVAQAPAHMVIDRLELHPVMQHY